MDGLIAHSCDFCRASRGRRALVALLERRPNISSAAAASTLDMSRPYLTQQRSALEARGCVPKRAHDGRSLRAERAAIAKALTTGGHPIAHTLAGDVEALREQYVYARRLALGLCQGYPIGSGWTP